MSDAAYREVEDRNILEAIRMQEEAGLATISDGEFRRGSWAFGLVNAVDGFGEARSMFEFHDAAGNSYPFGRKLFMNTIKPASLSKAGVPAARATNLAKALEFVNAALGASDQQQFANVSSVAEAAQRAVL